MFNAPKSVIRRLFLTLQDRIVQIVYIVDAMPLA